MKRMINACIVVFAIFLGFKSSATDSTGIKFSYVQVKISDKEIQLSIKARIPTGLKLYGLQKNGEDLLYSTISFDSSSQKYLSGTVVDQGVIHIENDSSVGGPVRFYTDSIVWLQKVRPAGAEKQILKGAISYIYKSGDEYFPGLEKIRLSILPAHSPDENSKTVEGLTTEHSLLWIFLTAFAGGLLALLTPCVYSMVPVTVSFFTKKARSRKVGIQNAIYYSISIILIFTVLGFLITIVFGPAALNKLATNWLANLFFFFLFLVFGFSFLGAFEINLPSSLTNRSGARSGPGDLAGIFFMALTLVLVSFSCTGPIIGNLLVLAAKGNFWGPLTGMFGFSLALALPFSLFAFFPSRLNVLGKAGGWLNSVKVTLGFFELALALKFLSNADLARGWRIMDREIFIAAWIVIFVLLGIYLLGKIKFHHDDELPKNDFGHTYLTVTRLFFAMAAFIFALYMVPGMWGAPLKGISAFVPPMGTQDFISSGIGNGSFGGNAAGAKDDNELPVPVRYHEQMKIYEPEVVRTYGLITYYDYQEALAVAKKLKRPLMLDFTGINCVNCRKMEGQVWSNPGVMKRLKEDFVVVSLYVDVQQIDLEEAEQYESKALGKTIETLGDKNADLQVTKYGSNSQPFYFFLDANENKLLEEGYGYDPDINKFIRTLDKVKARYDYSNKIN